MEKKIILSSVVIVALAGVGIGISQLDLTDYTSGAAPSDQCVAEIAASLQRADVLSCEVRPVILDQDKGPEPFWMCNDATVVSKHQTCLTDLLGETRALGQAIRFSGRQCPAGVCWDAEVAKPAKAGEGQIEP